MEQCVVKIARTWRTAEPPNAHTSEEVELFQRAPVASPGPDPKTPLVSPVSSPIEADCVVESTFPSSVHEDSAQPLSRCMRHCLRSCLICIKTSYAIIRT